MPERRINDDTEDEMYDDFDDVEDTNQNLFEIDI